MKTIISLFALFLIPLSGIAQEYCEVSYANDIEPITLVSFAGINNATNPAINGTPGHEFFDEDSTLFGHLDEEETYTIILQGNTNGNHTNTFSVFIDWNGNGDFTDPGENYPAGFVINSNGTDGQQSVTEITAPVGSSGMKRMRIIKHRTSTGTPEWPEDPCGGYEYGQAEDYTLMITHGDFECETEYSGDFENGLGNLQTRRYADDFIIGIPEFEVSVNKLFIRLFSNISTASIYFYKDAEGVPGELLGSRENLVPVWQEWVGYEFEMNVYENIFEFDPLYIGNGGELYWVAIATTAGNEGAPNYWETSLFNENAIAHYSEDAGTTWNPQSEGLGGAFGIYGICEEMSTGENPGRFDFAYYPNPVKDILKFDSTKKPESVEIFDTTGKMVWQSPQVKSGEISLKSLVPGTYFVRVKLENGQIETFRILKKDSF